MRPAFTGKETDCETGFSYFGARYYDPTLLTSWTAVDPMSDKYPDISPYAYCVWNPMKVIDPDGMDTLRIYLNSGEISYKKAYGDHSVEYYRENKLVESNTIKSSECKFVHKEHTGSFIDDGITTSYLYFSNSEIGESVFKKITKLGSDVEWNYHFLINNNGELSTSKLEGRVIFDEERYNKFNTTKWYHYHPANSSESYLPSDTDQNHARKLGVKCYIFTQSRSMRFDNLIPAKGCMSTKKMKDRWNSFAKDH
ncbi:MAG: RHS repeat-associated core domain-containing protein [Bacteroidales bacterium]|nr:RHS repeat-associated core domain-containing protein [Candidatus Colimorpha pelethequi]